MAESSQTVPLQHLAQSYRNLKAAQKASPTNFASLLTSHDPDSQTVLPSFDPLKDAKYYSLFFKKPAKKDHRFNGGDLLSFELTQNEEEQLRQNLFVILDDMRSRGYGQSFLDLYSQVTCPPLPQSVLKVFKKQTKHIIL